MKACRFDSGLGKPFVCVVVEVGRCFELSLSLLSSKRIACWPLYHRIYTFTHTRSNGQGFGRFSSRNGRREEPRRKSHVSKMIRPSIRMVSCSINPYGEKNYTYTLARSLLYPYTIPAYSREGRKSIHVCKYFFQKYYSKEQANSTQTAKGEIPWLVRTSSLSLSSPPV